MFGENPFLPLQNKLGDALSRAPCSGASINPGEIDGAEVLLLKSSLERFEGLLIKKRPFIPPPALAIFALNGRNTAQKDASLEEGGKGGAAA